MTQDQVNLTNPLHVLAGTIAGECSQGGRPGMENIASVVMQRVEQGWAKDARAVCLAPRQFSCWGDVNRERIMELPRVDPKTWALALAIAGEALGGTLARRTGTADSYFARTMASPPYWAVPPARHIMSDSWHQFWQERAIRPKGA